jgi:hypothetical protein
VQDAAVHARRHLGVRARRVGERAIEGLRDERDEVAVQTRDVRDARADKLDARGLSRAEQGRGLVERKKRKIGGDGGDGRGVYRPPS